VAKEKSGMNIEETEWEECKEIIGENRNTYKMSVSKPKGNRHNGRPSHRFANDIRNNV
jgi:hypothetical protein